jgi:hypothetical protein
MCGISLHPVSFVVVWHGNFLVDSQRINPWTNSPELRHTLVCQELWYFMTQTGCWAHPPSGYPFAPWAHTSARVTMKSSEAPTHRMRWARMMEAMYQAGALEPRSIHALAEFRDSLPALRMW